MRNVIFQPVTCLSVSDTLSRSACVITGGSAQALTLADALQKAVGALDMVRVRQSQMIKMFLLTTAMLKISLSLPFFNFFFISFPLSPHPRTFNPPTNSL